VPTTLQLPAARRLTGWLLAIMAALLSLSTLGQVSKHYLGHPKLMGFVEAFYIDYEANVPTWFSSLLLGTAGLLLALIAAVKLGHWATWSLHWLALSILLLMLSADEIAGFHELPIDPMRATFHTRGLLYYGWVVPGAALVLIVSAALARFLAHLPRSTRRWMISAGLVFVGGAIGVEMLSGAAADAWGEESFTYAMIVTVEEALEMLGVILLLHALVDYIHAHMGGLRVVFGQGASMQISTTRNQSRRAFSFRR
jgi:hypothetical protein